MTLTRLETLKQKYRFADWRHSNRLGKNLFISKFFLFGDELPGWKLYRVATLPGDSETPLCLRSIWRPTRSRGAGESMLGIDIYECVSRDAAHEFLVTLLGRHQSPIAAQSDGEGVGDVHFGGTGTWLSFARANLVISVRNAGRDLVDVTSHAQRLDKRLTSAPARRRNCVGPEIRAFELVADPAKHSQPIPLRLDITDPCGGQLYCKFFSKSGEVIGRAGGLVFQPQAPGPQDLTVYVVNSDHGAAMKRLQFHWPPM